MLRSIGKNVITKAGGHGRLGLLLAVAVAVLAAPLGQAAPAKTFTVSGKVTSTATNAGVSGANVALAGTGTSTSFTAVTNNKGNYTIGKVPTGAYTMTVSAPDFQTATKPVDLSKSTTLNVALAPGAKVSGTVTNSQTKAGVSGAHVAFTGAGTLGTFTAETDAGGDYVSGTMPAGNYSVDFSAPNYTTSTKSISLLSGSTKLDVALVPGRPSPRRRRWRWR